MFHVSTICPQCILPPLPSPPPPPLSPSPSPSPSPLPTSPSPSPSPSPLPPSPSPPSSPQQYERMVHLHKKTMQRFPETKNALDHFDIPTTVKDAENLMQEDLALKEKMINLFAESELKMDEFLTTLKGQQEIEHKSVSTVL